MDQTKGHRTAAEIMATALPVIGLSFPTTLESPSSQDQPQTPDPVTSEPQTRPRKLLFPLPAESDEAARSHWRKALFGLEPHHPRVPKLEMWGESFARRAIENRKPGWMILAGRTGCGKTHVARRVARFVADYALDAYCSGHWGVDRGDLPTVEFRDWPKTVEKKADDYDEAVSDVLQADVIVLDDVGAETDPYKSGEPISRLRSLLSRLERRAVLITTNLRAKEWADRDERIASRMSAARRLEVFDIPDYRPRLAQRASGIKP